MKIRTGFVSNSSSSSFVINGRTQANLILVGDPAQVYGFGYQEQGQYDYDSYEEYVSAMEATKFWEEYITRMALCAQGKTFYEDEGRQGKYKTEFPYMTFLTKVVFKDQIISEIEHSSSGDGSLIFSGINEWEVHFQPLMANIKAQADAQRRAFTAANKLALPVEETFQEDDDFWN